jgi:hypothetical protein
MPGYAVGVGATIGTKRSQARSGIPGDTSCATRNAPRGTLTVDLRLEFLRGKLASLDRRDRELEAARAMIAAKIVDLESRV